MKTTKLGLTPTLIVVLGVFGLAILVGVIFLMMLATTGIEHSPDQGVLENRTNFVVAASAYKPRYLLTLYVQTWSVRA